jgi:hypothetical protein
VCDLSLFARGAEYPPVCTSSAFKYGLLDCYQENEYKEWLVYTKLTILIVNFAVKRERLKSTHYLPPAEANEGERRFLGAPQTPSGELRPLHPLFMNGCQRAWEDGGVLPQFF